jgi:hypothetical protein
VLKSVRITAIPNFVNTKRFSTVRKPPARPRRALLFGNVSGLVRQMFPGRHLEA